MAVREFKKGDVIFREGDQGRSFFSVEDGCVGIFAHYGEPGEIKLTELGKGRIFGEMAVIEAYPRSASAVSMSDETKVEEVADEEIGTYLAEDPDRILVLMRHLGDRLADLTQEYNDVSGVIAEMRESEKKSRSESLVKRIRKHMDAYKARKTPEPLFSAEHFNDIMEENRDPEWYNKIQNYPKGTLICREGETIHCMYELHSGRVGIYTGYGTEEERQLTELYPNSYFGEMGMVRDEPRSATVMALEDSTVEIIYREDLANLFKKNPPKVEMILKHLSYRLRRLTDQYLDACALVCEAAEDENKNGKMSPELVGRIQSYKARLYG